MHKQDIITFIIFHKNPDKNIHSSNSLLKKMFYSSHWQLEKLFKNELFSRMKSCNLFLKTLRDREIFQFSWQIIPSFCTMVAKISLQCICSWFCQFQHSRLGVTIASKMLPICTCRMYYNQKVSFSLYV